MITIEVRGLDALERKLKRPLTPELRGFTQAVGEMIRSELAPYPPASEANVPNDRGRWYERGFGPRWFRKDGSVGGRKTSEMLNRQWGGVRHGRIGYRIFNRASYAQWVHSHEMQNWWHRVRGWMTDRKAVDIVARRGDIERAWAQMLRRWWR